MSLNTVCGNVDNLFNRWGVGNSVVVVVVVCMIVLDSIVFWQV